MLEGDLSQDGEIELEQILNRQFELLAFDQFKTEYLKGEDIEQDLDQYLSKNNTDLLVMVRGKKNFWEKIFHKGNTRKMAANNNYPLLVLQETI